MSAFVFVNDQFVEATKANVLITDLAIQRGYGIFDFFKTIEGKPIFFDEHFARFTRSTSHLRLDTGYSKDQLEAILRELMEKNQIANSGIRLTVTGGYSADGYAPAKPNLIITQQALAIEKGNTMKLVTYPHLRQMPEIKTIDYLMAIWLRPYIANKGADEVLYSVNGEVTEIPRANFFIVTHEDEVITAGKNVLRGVIRSKILSLKDRGFRIVERDLKVEEVYEAKEAFITSTTKNVLPITEIDGKRIGNGEAGKMTLQLLDEVERMIGV